MSEETKNSKFLNFETEIESDKKLEIKKEKISFIKVFFSTILFLTSIFFCITIYTSIQIKIINSENKKLENENTRIQEYIKQKDKINIFSPSNDLIYKKKEHVENILDAIFYPYTSDIITSLDELEFLRDIFGKVSIRLEYKSSIHGDKNDIFHNRTRKHNHQLVLIKTKKGNRFGGYTSENFEMNKLAELTMDVDKFDNTAFLFNLDSKKG